MKKLLLYFFLCFAIFCQAQTGTSDTASAVQIRTIPDSKLQQWKNSKDFNYDRNVEGLSFLQRLRMQILHWLAEFFSDRQRRNGFWIVLIVVCFAIVVFAILKLTGMSSGGMFERNTKKNLSYNEEEENIHEINFEDAISTAERNNDLRLAVRFHYLKLLKYLSDKGAILWKPNKTNHDYITEMNGAPAFIQLTNEFEYVWYGEREVNEEEYEAVKNLFNQQQNTKQIENV